MYSALKFSGSIFDLDASTVSKITKKFINKRQKKGKVYYTDTDLPRAFILCEKNKDEKIRLSRISTVGLKQRIENNIYSDENNK